MGSWQSYFRIVRAMDKSAVYVCDANSLIELARHFPWQTDKLRQFVSAGFLKIPEGVFRELKRGTDELAKYVQKWGSKYEMVIWIRDHRLPHEWNRINQSYGLAFTVGKEICRGFWGTESGKKGVDAQVVAVGRVYAYTVVSNDIAIVSACMLEDVPCIGWTEFARRLGIIKNYKQMKLIEEV